MKGLFDKTLRSMEAGMSEKIQAIPTGLKKYDDYVFGTRQACYYLYGAETGVGKTRFVREKHIYTVYDYFKEINDSKKLDVCFLDFSLEINGEENMASAISRRLYIDKGIVLPPDKLFSWGGKLSQEAFEQVKAYKSYFEQFEKKLFVFDEDTTPTKIHDILMDYVKKTGKWDKEGRFISECEGYHPNNPNLYTIVVVDTINLADIEPPHDAIKSTIDRISRILVWFRNKCGITPIVIQQFNAEISAVDRNRYGIKTPLLRDFEDSKKPTKDANVVFGLFDPSRHMKEDEKSFAGYDIEILRSWFRSLHLLKHRNGPTNKFIPLQYKGAVGTFEQLPPASEMTPEKYTLYTRY